MRTFNWPLGAAIACILLVITLAIIVVYNQLLARKVVGGRQGGEAML
jgi:ABC-type spermidine/putrescine transport system permease subunit I